MNQPWFKRAVLLAFATMLVAVGSTSAHIDAKHRKESGKSEEVQRTPTGPFDLQRNVVSNVDFYTTNYGIFGYNIANQVGGTYWPRGSNNQYLFAGGGWFAALKAIGEDKSDLRKRVMITYNPNSGQSWMVPGSHEDGTTVDASGDGTTKNRTYFSTEFSSTDGTDFAEPSFPNWPIWDSSDDDTLRVNNYYGYYINDIDQRNTGTFRKGPAYISNEDVYAIYRDTDLSRYEGGATQRAADGYPLGFQIEQIIYSWGSGDYADMLFIKYLFIHPEEYQDTLYDCWMAAVMDVDIALRTSPRLGAANDRARYYSEEDTLNLAVQWTNPDRGEGGQGFGYLGFNFLESPAIDADGFLRKDKKQFPVQEQLGLRTMRNWPITVDPLTDEDRYNFMTSGQRDGDDGPGDRRLLMATGPFNMRAGDSARIVVGLIMAETATGKDATGTTEDMTELIRKVRFAQFVYNNQFRAPQAPDLPVIRGYAEAGSFFDVPERGWLPLNNAVIVQWDSTAELSVDTLEGGMDFLGYRVYRARRTDLDTFNVDLIPTQRVGPLAWKQIGQIGLPSPFIKSANESPGTGVFIDEFRIADPILPGQKEILVQRFTTNGAPWNSYFSALQAERDPGYGLVVGSDGFLQRENFDKLDSIRFTVFTVQLDSLPTVARDPDLNINAEQEQIARDSLIKLIQAKKVDDEPFMFADTVRFDDGNGNVEVESIMRRWEETSEIRHNVIPTYIRSISRGRTFYDFGDDDGNGVVNYSENVERTEKLINNIDYYYAIRPYDEGDYLLGTKSELASRAVGLPNTVKTSPQASRPGENPSVEFRIDDESRARFGGIYNLRMLVNEDQRFNQLFAGKTLSLSFYRDWFSYDNDQDPATTSIGLYNTLMFLQDSTTGQILSTWQTALPPQLCGGVRRFAGWFTENSVTWVDTSGLPIDTLGFDENFDPVIAILDTVYDVGTGQILRIDTTTFMNPSNTEQILRTGSYQTDAVCFGNKYALGTIGVAFDYGIQQYGGIYRSVKEGQIVSGGDPNIYVGSSITEAARWNDSDTLNQPPLWYEIQFPEFVGGSGFQFATSYNNGPGVYEITFEEAGTETLTTEFLLSDRVGDEDGKDSVMTFENVPVYNMRIRNVTEYDRPDINEQGVSGTATVSYPFDLEKVDVPINGISELPGYPSPALVPLGSYASATYGWRNTHRDGFRGTDRRFYAAERNTGNPIGTGKYYGSRNLSTTGKDTLDFIHVISIGGATFAIDFSRRGRKNFAYRVLDGLDSDPDVYPNTDFQDGDKVRLSTFGGAIGFPFDRAKAFVKVGQYDPEVAGRSFTDENLEQITVAPNPYYVTHEGIRSSFEGRLYFGRLPRKATIEIYTTAGALVKTYQHDETTSDDPSTFGTEVWDLLTTNNQRVTSQLLIAKITTPDGASVMKKFTIVVGPARIVQE